MRFDKIIVTIAWAAALAFAIGSTASADQCGPAPKPRSAIGQCLKANGAKWMFGPTHHKCEWYTPDRAIWVKCGLVSR